MMLFGLSGDEVQAEYTKRIIVTILVAATTSTATFFVGRWYGRYKASRQWHAKEFLDREETHYIVAVIGLPDGISRSLEDQDQLKTAARIERDKDGSPLNPEKVETRAQDGQTAVYFFFPRSEPITLEDKNVRFLFTLPELDVQREFKLRNMVYRDKLEI